MVNSISNEISIQMLFYMKKKVAKLVNLFCFIPTIVVHKVNFKKINAFCLRENDAACIPVVLFLCDCVMLRQFSVMQQYFSKPQPLCIKVN